MTEFRFLQLRWQTAGHTRPTAQHDCTCEKTEENQAGSNYGWCGNVPMRLFSKGIMLACCS